VRVDRTIHHGLHEDYDLVNYSSNVIDLDLELRIAGDYADLFDVKEHRLVRRGSLESRWDQDDGMLTTIYRNRDFERTGSLLPHPPSAQGAVALLPARDTVGRLRRESGKRPIKACHALLDGDPELAARRREWRRRATKIRTSDRGVNAVALELEDVCIGGQHFDIAGAARLDELSLRVAEQHLGVRARRDRQLRPAARLGSAAEPGRRAAGRGPVQP